MWYRVLNILKVEKLEVPNFTGLDCKPGMIYNGLKIER
jgi:hypothetical protein